MRIFRWLRSFRPLPSSDLLPLGPRLREEMKPASNKLALAQYFILACFLFLISGFWDLQVRNPEFYSERAEQNRIKALPILAPRGKILDREGRVIVDNHASFNLILSRENLKEEHLPWIAAGLNLDYGNLKERLRRFSTRPRYEPIVVKEELTLEELIFVEANRDPATFPEMELIDAQRRVYPSEKFAAHLIGYTGEISDAELNTMEFADRKPGDIIGKAGIERQYNDVLMGEDGQRRVVVDNRGRERAVLDRKEAVPGRNLTLTIDLDLQAVAELAMEGRKGAVVALDPRNGEVLALVSTPAYDPSRFAGRIRPADWFSIINDPDKPMLNRAIQGQLAPGSTFKPIVALAGLEEGIIDDNFTTVCSGGATFYGRYFKCHRRGGHGRQDLIRAIANSCDVFFYTVGNRLGIDTIAKYAELVGLGAKTGIDLPGEAEGVVPSTQWKIRNFRQKWYAGETISVAIGQGALTVTPLQLASAIGGIAVGGAWYTPHLVKDSALFVNKPRVAQLNPDNVAKVIQGMYAVVNAGGTGARAQIPGIEVCGKTGTAQLASNEYVKRLKAHEVPKDNAWFVGFAPRINPEIVVVALWEGGEHGNLAAPIVRDVMRVYFDKKRQRQAKENLMAGNMLAPRLRLTSPAAAEGIPRETQP